MLHVGCNSSSSRHKNAFSTVDHKRNRTAKYTYSVHNWLDGQRVKQHTTQHYDLKCKKLLETIVLFGESLTRAISVEVISKRCAVRSLAGSLIHRNYRRSSTNLLDTQTLTLHFTRHEETFVKQLQYTCECVQEWIKWCGRMNLFPKVLTIYTFPDNGANTLITVL